MIDEKKLIEDLVDTYCSDCSKCQGICRHDELFKIIDRQPKVNNWIPCFERLPEECEQVLVWFEYFRYGDYNRLYQTIGISYTFDGKWSGFVNGQSGWHKLRIIAWQPLPAPYKEDMRGGKNERNTD